MLPYNDFVFLNNNLFLSRIVFLIIPGIYEHNIPSHEIPSPIYPVWQVQKKEPAVFVQFASAWQLWWFLLCWDASDPGLHSFTSIKRIKHLDTFTQWSNRLTDHSFTRNQWSCCEPLAERFVDLEERWKREIAKQNKKRNCL